MLAHQMGWLRSGYGRIALASAALLAFGLIQRQLLPEPDATSAWRSFYELERSASLQLGVLGLLLALVAAVTAPLGRRVGITGAHLRGALLPVVFALAVAAVAGELFLRVWFREGASFGSFSGPIMDRFQRDFVTNRYDGPSRGPEIDPSRAGAWRIVVLGDSMSWGQGVRREEEVYTARLLTQLRAEGAPVELAVLASPGRQIDTHLAQLRRYAGELAPDLVVYQFYLDDLELETFFQGPFLPWRRFFLHYPLVKHSYLWFFLDNRLDATFRASGVDDYRHYLETRYGEGAPGWNAFAGLFETFAAEAHAATPRVLLVMFPALPPMRDLYARIAALAEANGVAALDLTEALVGNDDYPPDFYASPYDPHPSADAHADITRLVQAEIAARWPELSGPRP
jgi:hypothetical protein